MDELVRLGVLVEGQIDPTATILAMEPIHRQNWLVTVESRDFFVELLEMSPSGATSPGEIVSARVRIGGAKTDGKYRIVAKPLQASVKILGEAEHQVRGSTPTLLRFTSTEGGRAGISVDAQRLE